MPHSRRPLSAHPTRSFVFGIFLVAIFGCTPRVLVRTAPSPAPGDWPVYGYNAGGDRFSPLSQIDRGNVARLEVAWRFHIGETAPGFATSAPTALEATPLVFEGTMYLSTPLGRVFALDPVTGAQRWAFDPGVDRTIRFGDFVNRGVALWVDTSAAPGAVCRLRIFVSTIDARLISLDGATGRRCAGFGIEGQVNLKTGLRNAPANAAESAARCSWRFHNAH